MTARIDVYAEENRTEFDCTHGKSKAKVNNNKRLLSRYCTVEANY